MRGEFSSTYNSLVSDAPVFGSCFEGLTQLSFLLTSTEEGPTSCSGGNTGPCDCIYNCIWDYIWDCIWPKDNISCWVTFSVIDCSSWSLIFCVSCSRSLRSMDLDVRELLQTGSKYYLIIILVQQHWHNQGALVAQWMQSVHPTSMGDNVMPWKFTNCKSMFNVFPMLFDYFIYLDELRCCVN